MFLTIFWLILAIIFIVVELSTAAYISFWFIFGAVVTMFLSFAVSNIQVQIAVFLLVSLLLLLFIRPFALKFAKPKAKSNIDALIDMEGIVTETIDNTANRGRVQVIGQDWAAMTEDKSIIKPDKHIIVLGVKGNKLIVKEINK